MTRKELAVMIDHTQVRAFATQDDITALCDEARRAGFRCVAVNPAWTTYCAKRLAGSNVGISVTVGFPLGANTARTKLEEAREAVSNGATELEMVINIGALKSGFPDFVEREIAAVVKGVRGVPVKVILETNYLDTDEKTAVCEMSMRAGAAYVQTCTGFGGGGATAEDVALMRHVVGKALGVKAAGGIRTSGDVGKLARAGATRIGTSAGVDILLDVSAKVGPAR